jgi:hypothetical protein
MIILRVRDDGDDNLTRNDDGADKTTGRDNEIGEEGREISRQNLEVFVTNTCIIPRIGIPEPLAVGGYPWSKITKWPWTSKKSLAKSIHS